MFLMGKILENDSLRLRLSFWRSFSAILFVCLVLFVTCKGIDRFSFLSFLPEKYVAKINVDGYISGEDEQINFFNKLSKNPKILGVILKINSPGGSFSGSEKVYQAISKMSQSKKVVSVVEDIAASGGYMVASGTNYIIASNSSLTGSIGVIMQYYGVHELAKKLGVQLDSIKSSPLKGSPSPFEKPSDLSLSNSKEIVKKAYNYFTFIVTKNRKISDKKLAFSGRVFLGADALSIGLIDEIGGEDEAVNWLKSQNVSTKNIKPLQLHTKNHRMNAITESISSFLLNIFGIELTKKNPKSSVLSAIHESGR